MAHPQLAHPSFVGQAFSPFAPPHAFAHPAFPFIPSPHPSQNSATNNYVSYSPNGQLTPGGTAEQQKRMQQFQQAQWAAAANQMEMLRNQQQSGNYQQDGELIVSLILDNVGVS
jgi:anti-sigma28 factor (negative regulator of flagellin synthesis)